MAVAEDKNVIAPLEDGSVSPEKTLGQTPSMWAKFAFYAWLTLLFISLGTFAVGLSGHILAILAAPWLSFETQAVIHISIPVLLTAVKFVTVPLLVLLTPFANHHPTFHFWTDWSKAKIRQLEAIVEIPVRAALSWIKSIWSRLTGTAPRQ